MLSHGCAPRQSLCLYSRRTVLVPRRAWCRRSVTCQATPRRVGQLNGVVPGPRSTPSQPSSRPSQEQPAKPDFNWTKQWYPLVPVSYLDKSKPKSLTVLGRKLAVWYHAPSSSWRCFEDRCPHRLAPLSEGRIEPSTGALMCSYHGWQFDDSGRCTSIPQADSPQLEAAATGSARACVSSYPVREEQGLLWVWLESGAEVVRESAVWPRALPSELRDRTGVLLGDWYMRDLPVGYESLVENLLDPAHVHFAHHGVIGRRNTGGPIPLTQEGALSAEAGFAVRMERSAAGTGMPAVTHFLPPSLVWLSLRPGGAAGSFSFSMLFYAVPVAPGHSRILAGYSTAAPPLVRQALTSGALTPLLHAFQWLGDLGAHEVIDGDTVFLYNQDARNAEEAGRRGWGSTYFMPASSDKAVVLLRRWLMDYAGGGPTYGPAVPRTQALLTRKQILDRYEQHTKDCPHCSRALRGVRALRGGLSLATTSSLVAALTLAVLQTLLLGSGAAAAPPLFPRSPPFVPRLPLPGPISGSAPFALLAAGLAAALLNQSLGQLERRFLFTDYEHHNK